MIGGACDVHPSPPGAQAARQGVQAAVLGAGLGLSPPIPVKSKRLELGFPGEGPTLVLGKLGGGAGRRSKWEMSVQITIATFEHHEE